MEHAKYMSVKIATGELVNQTKRIKMLAIDWSHTKGLTTYDGKKLQIEDKKALIKRLNKKNKDGGESKMGIKSMFTSHSPSSILSEDKDGEESRGSLKSRLDVHSLSLILEQGCPTSLIYDLLRVGSQVYLISNRATQDHRVAHGIEKTDENDARIIWELANNGTKLRQVNLDDRIIQMHSLYHQYCRYQKARVAMQNMRKAYLRHFGDGESTQSLKSTNAVQPSPDASGIEGSESSGRLKSIGNIQLPSSEEGESTSVVKSKLTLQPSSDSLPYDIAIDTLKTKERSLLAKLKPLIAGGESISCVQSKANIQPPAIRGLGDRIWAGIVVTANPVYFKCLSAYLGFCGLTENAIKGHKYSRHVRMLYHMLADEVMKQKDPTFRPVYDKCKADIAERYPDYTKLHIHNAALNRTATMLAKAIFQYYNKPGGESTDTFQSTRRIQPPG